MEDELLKHKIAISLIPGIGPILAKNLVSYCGSIEAVFKTKAGNLERVPGIGPASAKAIVTHNVFRRAEEEIEFVKKHKIKVLFYNDKEYPERLKRCNDSPLLLYYKGLADLNATRVISIVGTRNATEYGRTLTEQLVEDLAPMNVLIVSGMAYGIDIYAHRASLKNKVPTVGVFGHGLDRVYPAMHASTAEKMLEQGGLLSEYTSGVSPDKMNFPMRNRIVAGLADATIIVEAGIKGGALITAELANSYHRDVFAFPGKVQDTYSQGCNRLIKINKAALIESAKDITYIMGWESDSKKQASKQPNLFPELSPEEKSIMDLFTDAPSQSIDAICSSANLSTSKVAAILLNLEFEGLVKALPGKVFQVVK